MDEGKRQLAVGDIAPDFTMPSTRGTFSLSRAVKDRPILLYFYPMDFGQTCTRYMAEMKRHGSEMDQLGVVMVHVNPETLDQHREWADVTGSPYEHVTDEGQRASRMYGAIITNQNAPKVLGRTNREFFLVDQEMRIRYIWRADMPADTIPIEDLVGEIKGVLGI